MSLWEVVQPILIYAYELREWGILFICPNDNNQLSDSIIDLACLVDANFTTYFNMLLSVTACLPNFI